MWISGLKGLTLLGPKVACSRLQDSSAVELLSFRPKVDSPDGVRQDSSRFARCHKTLYNMHGEHTFRDVILVTLGLHMYSHCLSMLSPFFQA